MMVKKMLNQSKKSHFKRPYIPDHPEKILIIFGSGSGESNVLLNLKHQSADIDKIYIYVKDPFQS